MTKLTKLEAVEKFLKATASEYTTPEALAEAVMQKCKVFIYVYPKSDYACSTHAFKIFHMKSGEWNKKPTGWVYVGINELAQSHA